MIKFLKKIIRNSNDRYDLWVSFLQEKELKNVAEVGVYKGDYAEKILLACKDITRYLMIDPWRQLDDWNKPANVIDETFEEFFNETMSKTDFAKEKRQVLRGRTQDVRDDIEDNSLDFAYIDGDHTLRGISIDLISIWDKIKPNGYIAGDDFCSSVWQHDKVFEPTLVFPFAVYFAEAKNVKIYALPFNQFLIIKGALGFEFIDLTKGKYKELNLLNQLKITPIEKKQSFISKLFK
ncbi:class I SAM-dependent methyltransferase [Xanthomarina gelatinilytica]|uniref:class I SAM-dependent methyltransferase n=1 Tax=Xanthomarina gelatinilytica TaxID=1137281 RepID=UPI003AA7B6A2